MPEIGSGVFSGRTTGSPILIRFRESGRPGAGLRGFRETPRPGHVDFVADKKFGGLPGPRGGGHFSGRLTVGPRRRGSHRQKDHRPGRSQRQAPRSGRRSENSPSRRGRPDRGDSIGGLIECRATGLPAGLGEPFFDSVESVLSSTRCSPSPASRGSSSEPVSRGRDAGSDSTIRSSTAGPTRTNHSGGLNGGLSNGNPLVFRVAVRPTASISRIQGRST